jgi:lipopolysaccharide/colanic/teichoic acid biosynthesis glycosyltransferase
VLPVTWLAGCAIVAMTSVGLSRIEGLWPVGLGAIVAAQAVLLAARRAHLPTVATWGLGLACLAAGALAYDGTDRLVYLGLAPLLLVVVNRFAVLSEGLSAFVLVEGAAGRRAPPDPVARDFARVRRERVPLTVASIAAAQPRGAGRRLARVTGALVPHLRVADTVVRVAADGVVVVLPGADEPVARAVLDRLPARQRTGLLMGTATFPEDGQSYARLKEVARSRRRPWPAGPGSGAKGRADPELPVPAREDRAAVLLETRTATPIVRRVVDLLMLALAAPIVVPLVALLAVAVKLDSPGPAFVRIPRLGRDGQPFGLLKLRSMRRDADRMKEELRHLNTMAWPDFKIADDPRITRLGHLLRKYSLDELPQLYNVLRGDMTMVGPRPCSVKLADYDLWQSERLDVTPGVVGRWQAEGRGAMDFTERCRLDIRQLRSRSATVNVRLFVATVRSVFDTRGAY